MHYYHTTSMDQESRHSFLGPLHRMNNLSEFVWDFLCVSPENLAFQETPQSRALWDGSSYKNENPASQTLPSVLGTLGRMVTLGPRSVTACINMLAKLSSSEGSTGEGPAPELTWLLARFTSVVALHQMLPSGFFVIWVPPTRQPASSKQETKKAMERLARD